MVVFLSILVTFTSEFLFLRQWRIHIVTSIIRAPSVYLFMWSTQSKAKLCAFKHVFASKTVRYFALQVLDSQHEGCKLPMKAYRRHAVFDTRGFALCY